MPWSEPVIPVDAPIGPRDPADATPSHIANYGRGGWHAVADIAARNAIPSERLVVGMAVRVVSEGKEYRLTSVSPVTWNEFTGGGSVTLPQGRVAGRYSAGTGTYEPVPVGDGLEMDSTSLRVSEALTAEIDAIAAALDAIDGIFGGLCS
jgi:hypothetical protein